MAQPAGVETEARARTGARAAASHYSKSILSRLSPLVSRGDGLPRYTAIAAVFLLLWGVFALMDWHTGTIRGDFTRYSLAASGVLWEGGNPYSAWEVGQNYKYLPVNAFLLGPLTLLPIPIAQGFWTTLNLTLVIIALWMQWRFLREFRLPPWLMIALLVLGFRSIHSNLKMGQWNTTVYTLGIIGVLLLYKHRNLLGAAVLGLAASLKFIPAAFMLPFLLKGRWRPPVGTVLAITFWCLLLPGVVLGPQRLSYLYTEFRSKSEKVVQDQTGQTGQRTGVSLNALIFLYSTPAFREDVDRERTINIANLSPQRAGMLANGASLAILLGTVAMSLSLRNVRPDRMVFFLEVSLWITTMMLVLPHVRVHYLIYMVTPTLGLLAFWYRWRWVSRAAWVAFGVVAFSLLAQILSSQDITGRTLSTEFNLHGMNTVMVLLMHGALIQALWVLGWLSPALESPAEQQGIAHDGHAA